MSIKTVVVAFLFVASACTNSEPLSPLSAARPGVRPLFQAVPADGNGNKIVTPIEVDFPAFATCASGATLDLHIVGWIQDRPGRGGNSQQLKGIVTFQFEFTFSNAAGETYVWHQVGSEVFHSDKNGNFVVAVSGRTLDNVGRMVINLDTGEVDFVAGRQPFAEDVACAALS